MKTSSWKMKAIGCFTLVMMAAGAFASDPSEENLSKRPWMFVTGEQIDGLRSLVDVRRDIRQGRSAQLWKDLVAKVEREMALEPWTPTTGPPFRSEESAKLANREFFVVAMTGNRIQDAALVALVTGDRRYVEAALRQIDALFDSKQWPDWIDKRHQPSMTVDLRYGQFARALGLAYDWLHVLLTEDQRRRFLERLDTHAVQRYLAAVEAEESWLDRQSNWKPCIVGGFGILGMSLGADHRDAARLVEIARPRMDRYMDVFGPEGEFNESVQYAGDTRDVVNYLLAEYYASGGASNPLEQYGMSDFCRWYMYGTLPPDHVLGFGDPAVSTPPVVAHFSAIASVQRDSVLQWFYLQYAHLMHPTHRSRALELLFYDPTLEAKSPQGLLPLGRAYHHEAKLISSRSSWDPKSATSIVYAKAGQETYHGHPDWGQVCIDGFGERLIVDLGSPSGYPKDHKDRYYNYQQSGHNVLVFGKNKTGGIPLGKARHGKITRAEFDDARGGAWTMDLSEAYGEERHVVRHVVHLLPRVAVVLDEAILPDKQPISLRWHTAAPAEPDSEGRFTVRGKKATLTGQTVRLDGEIQLTLQRHEYQPPYNKNDLGIVFSQRREPFVQIQTEDTRCQILSLFCVFGPDEREQPWKSTLDGWTIETPEGAVRIRVENNRLIVEDSAAERNWQTPMQALR